jgi:hypothetical protein
VGEQTAESVDDLVQGIIGEKEGEVRLLGAARRSIGGKDGVYVTDC